MSRLKWDETGKRYYETGVSNGVLFVYDPTANSGAGAYGDGVAWNGLSNVTESPSGAEASDIYADNIKYLSLLSAETYGATIEAYMYPDEFKACNGEASIAAGAGKLTVGQQSRSTFGFAFKTLIGNDTQGTDAGYKITLVYGCKATPSEKSHATVNESPEAATMSWTINTTPVNVGTINGVEYKPTATVVVDSRDYQSSDALKAALKNFEDHLWGRDGDSSASPAVEALTPTFPDIATAIQWLTPAQG